MGHLSRGELIESLDGPLLPASRQAHLDGCSRCGAERASLTAVLEDVSRVPVPEPSPLFWEHLSARVRERVAEEPLPAAPDWLDWLGWRDSSFDQGIRPPRAAWAAAATVALCVTAGWVGWQEWPSMTANPHVAMPALRHAPVTRLPRAADAARASSAANAALAAVPIVPSVSSSHAIPAMGQTMVTTDDDWNLMVQVVEDVAWDDEPGNGWGSLRPGTTDAVVRDLTADERRELVRILNEEMARPPSS